MFQVSLLEALKSVPFIGCTPHNRHYLCSSGSKAGIVHVLGASNSAVFTGIMPHN